MSSPATEKPGVRVLVLFHDDRCPKHPANQTGECQCQPQLQMMTPAQFRAGFRDAHPRNRAQRRKAAKLKARTGARR